MTPQQAPVNLPTQQSTEMPERNIQAFVSVAVDAKSFRAYTTSYINDVEPQTVVNSGRGLLERPEWVDKEYRQAYLEGFLEANIALQIRANREARNLSQHQLAQMIGTKQGGVSRLEDTTYGKHSVRALMRLANAFDCALDVRFVPYAHLARMAANVTEQSLVVRGYEHE